ncbi:SDR family NAD(P)-dependent oxidoreductase [Alkalibacterium sp. 20]|uniref:SDR family NAD(P)-dependent oxidoreductase n=1 Tax=Alkalibacterium sp. 20 TaxID=1798803 RepID=UPI0008FFFCCF|nr:SDR family oxidoreductase [Alkalibacterium sp. 20]OJF94020.1 short-chain dehydrogenase [Alkalibacterium sp. 20]
MLDVKNKWVLVTGASRGIGREIALAMAKKGANVIVHSRELAHTESLVEEIKELSVEAFSVAAELSNEEEVRKMADTVSEKAAVDILFNNAGVMLKGQDPYWQVDVSEYAWTYQVNVIAPMILIEKFLPGMLERKFGRIINTTSGIKNSPAKGAYAASKGALDKLTKDYAKKLKAKNVTINAIDPGSIKTDLGGENASHDVETVIPGMIIGAFVPKEVTGQWLAAQDYRGKSLEEALEMLE